MIHEFQNIIELNTPLGIGYAWYLHPNKFWNNDEITVILKDTGQIKHFTTDQLTATTNNTYKINEQQTSKETSQVR